MKNMEALVDRTDVILPRIARATVRPINYAHMAGLITEDGERLMHPLKMGNVLRAFYERHKDSDLKYLVAYVVNAATGMPGVGYWGYSDTNMPDPAEARLRAHRAAREMTGLALGGRCPVCGESHKQ